MYNCTLYSTMVHHENTLGPIWVACVQADEIVTPIHHSRQAYLEVPFTDKTERGWQMKLIYMYTHSIGLKAQTGMRS